MFDCLVVSTNAIDCLERLVSDMSYYVSSRMLNPTHSLTHSVIVVKSRIPTNYGGDQVVVLTIE